MTISVAGKGGVGKTTLCSLLAIYLEKLGKKVLAIDADPDANLAQSLGAEDKEPLAKRTDLLKSIVQNEKSGLNGFYQLNTTVEDVVLKYGSSWGSNGELLTLGWSKNGGSGCYCVENTALTSLINSIDKNAYDYIIIDGEAGLEHLSRGVVASSDLLILVYQMGKRSAQTAKDAKKLAQDIGIKNILNGICGFKEDEEDLLSELFQEEFAIKIPYSDTIRKKDLLGEELCLDETLENEFRHFLGKVIND